MSIIIIIIIFFFFFTIRPGLLNKMIVLRTAGMYTTTTATTNTNNTNTNNNNNNNNNSKSLRQYLSNIPGKHEIKELQRNSHLGNYTHISESTNVKE
jgi:hypothetical protein